MKLKTRITKTEIAAFVLFIILVLLNLRCTQEQWGAVADASDDLAYVTGATTQPASTQPAERAKLDAITKVVTVTKTVYPPLGGIITLVGGIATIFAGVGHKYGKVKSFKYWGNALGEVADDILIHRERNVPFSDATKAALVKVGRAHIAELENDLPRPDVFSGPPSDPRLQEHV